MIKEEEILVTGGSGLLGSEIKKLMPKAHYPTHEEFNTMSHRSQVKWMESKNWKFFDVLVHLAAYTSPPKVKENPILAMSINIKGTISMISLAKFLAAKLIYLSTDYVFDGSKGNYNEHSPVLPVNKYAWSKLGGECAVRMYDNSLIIRTSFGENKFPYEKAFIDQWTSRQAVSVIAKKIVRIINEKPDLTGVIHIGGERKTVYEYAKESKLDVGRLKRADVDFNVPKDTSLDCSKYKELFGKE